MKSHVSHVQITELDLRTRGNKESEMSSLCFRRAIWLLGGGVRGIDRSRYNQLGGFATTLVRDDGGLAWRIGNGEENR